MLRITVVESSGDSVRLRAEGRLVGHWVEELRKSCEVHALEGAIRLNLDLADVSFVDASGIELLKGLRSRCVTLLNPSPFVSGELKNVDPCDEAHDLEQ